ncbi:hypothetical protein ES703_79405 [subsurface metagenome]
MEQTDWIYIIAIVFMICVTALGIAGVLPTDDITDLLLLIIAIILGGGTVAFKLGKRKGRLEASA